MSPQRTEILLMGHYGGVSFHIDALQAPIAGAAIFTNLATSIASSRSTCLPYRQRFLHLRHFTPSTSQALARHLKAGAPLLPFTTDAPHHSLFRARDVNVLRSRATHPSSPSVYVRHQTNLSAYSTVASAQAQVDYARPPRKTKLRLLPRSAEPAQTLW